MAKRKKSRKSYSRGRKRSRMSGIGAIDIMNMVNKFIPSTINDKIVSGGKVALGVALPMLSKDGKTKNILSGVGAGMIAVGSVELLKSFGVLSGLGADDETISVSLDGIGESVLAESVLAEDVLSMDSDDLSVVNGIGEDDLSVVNGIGEDDLSVVNGDDEDFFM